MLVVVMVVVRVVEVVIGVGVWVVGMCVSELGFGLVLEDDTYRSSRIGCDDTGTSIVFEGNIHPFPSSFDYPPPSPPFSPLRIPPSYHHHPLPPPPPPPLPL